MTLREAKRMVYAEVLESLYEEADWHAYDEDGHRRSDADIARITRANREFVEELEVRLVR
jgi:hypothetical protein